MENSVYDSNEMEIPGKIIAGVLLILFTIAGIATVMAYWPDKMPKIGEGENAWYTGKRFNLKLIEKPPVVALDSVGKSSAVQNTTSVSTEKNEHGIAADEKKIHLNTILLILVATMGFLGNMIHIASSITAFVGNGQFKKNWTLWYFVKPFTAAALALIVYFIIRAGFLSYGSDASNISLFGILSLAALSGLFTDSATLKLKEVFEVMFKPKDERSDKLKAGS